MIASDLSGFMARPLKQNHACTEERHSSSLTLPDWSVGDRAMKSWVSSAYCCNWTPKWLAMWLIGEVKIVNKRGPRTDPCGTPVVQKEWSDRAVPIPTCWDRLKRYEAIQFKAVPYTQKLWLSLDNSIWWSTVSKAYWEACLSFVHRWEYVAQRKGESSFSGVSFTVSWLVRTKIGRWSNMFLDPCKEETFENFWDVIKVGDGSKVWEAVDVQVRFLK